MAISPLGIGLYLGSQALSGLFGAQQSREERQEFQDMIRERRRTPEGIALQEAVARLGSLSRTLPGQFEQGLTSRAQSAAAARRNRLNRSLARAGFTGGSEVAQRGQRGLVTDLISQRADISQRRGQLEVGLQSQLARTSQAAGQFFNPLAQGPERQFFDPFQVLGQIALLTNRGGGGGGDLRTGGVPNANTAAYNPVPFAGSQGQLQLPGQAAPYSPLRT